MPATKLAAELGCSGVMFGKICRRHGVPKPYLGYWAKLAHAEHPASPPRVQSILCLPFAHMSRGTPRRVERRAARRG